MTSPYRSFEELRSQELEGKDYQIRFDLKDERVLIMAPHGGKIERTTSNIAEAIAGENYSLYSFEGVKIDRNDVLHIESHLFDEPRALQAVKKADVVITVHGQINHEEEFVMIGGLNVGLAFRNQAPIGGSWFSDEDSTRRAPRDRSG